LEILKAKQHGNLTFATFKSSMKTQRERERGERLGGGGERKKMNTYIYIYILL
jgi:hypothetical protein